MRKDIVRYSLSILCLGGVLACSNPGSDEEARFNKRIVELESTYWSHSATSQILLNRLQSQQSQVLWSTNFHTAAPVPVGAVGPSKYIDKLNGIVNNDSIGRVVKEAVADGMNVIYVIGDGMGNMHMALPIYMRRATGDPEPTMFERIMREGACGFNYTCTSEGIVTGSAASGTALACGEKTRMNMVGMNRDGEPMESAMALAKKNHFKTAVVSDAGITDATPAAFYAHSLNRDLESDIARQLFETKVADVVLGGGGSQFIPVGQEVSQLFNTDGTTYTSARKDSLNLFEAFATDQYNLCFTKEQMQNAPKDEKLIGLFAGGGLPPVIDRGQDNAEVPLVEEMAQQALEMISQDGHSYMAMIECARIDWEAHDNDLGSVYQAVEDMNRVLETAYAFYAKNPKKTLLLFTADHETGGLEIAYKKMPKEEEDRVELPAGGTWTNITNPLSFKDYQTELTRQTKSLSGILMESKTVESLQANLQKYMGVSISAEDAAMVLESRNSYKRYKDE